MPKYKIILIILIILLVTLSWTFSSMSRTVSSNESAFVANLFRPLLDLILGESNWNLPFFDKLIRKTAHVVEYLLISCMLTILFEPVTVKTGPVLSLSIALILAMCDETIQIFSERGSALTDVWLDFGGAVVGFFIGLFIYFVPMKKHFEKKKLREIKD